MAFPWENSSPLIFCLKTHKSALFVWTGVSSATTVYLFIISVYLDQIRWLDSFRKWNEWLTTHLEFKTRIKISYVWFFKLKIDIFLLWSWVEVLMRWKSEASEKPLAAELHKIPICLKSSQEIFRWSSLLQFVFINAEK